MIRLKQILSEIDRSKMVYTVGFQLGAADYAMGNKRKDLSNGPELYQRGYNEGWRNARKQKRNDLLTRFLAATGDVLGHAFRK